MKNSISERFRLGMDYLNYLVTAKTRHGVHSPFVFDLMNDVFRDKRNFYAFEEIEKIRKQLLADSTPIDIKSYGEKSKTLSDKRMVADIAKVTSVPVKYGKLLFRLVNHFQPNTILELGTGLGLSTLYLGAAAQEAKFITLEGSSALADLARENIARLRLSKVSLVAGEFERTFQSAINELGKLDFVFIDGDHRKEALLKNMSSCLPHVSDKCVIVIDDIYWSSEMKEAWQQIIDWPQVTVSLDIFRMGILFFRTGIPKQHFKILY